MVTADVDGMDLAFDEQVRRVHWSAPVAGAGGVRAELVRMAKEARARRCFLATNTPQTYPNPYYL